MKSEAILCRIESIVTPEISKMETDVSDGVVEFSSCLISLLISSRIVFLLDGESCICAV